MAFRLCQLLLLNLYFCNIYEINASNKEIDKYLRNLMAHLNEFLLLKSNWEIISKYAVGKKECADLLVEGQQNAATLNKALIFSGKSFSDIGSEEDCKANNMTYLLLSYELNHSTYFTNTYYHNYYDFVNKRSYYSGICLWVECNEFYTHFFNMMENKQFNQTLEELGILNLKLYRHDYYGNEEAKNKEFQSKYKMSTLMSMLWMLSLYLIFRVIVSLGSYFAYEMNSAISESPQVQITIPSSQLERNNPQIKNAQPSDTYSGCHTIHFLTGGGADFSYKKSFCYNFSSVFSIQKGFKRLFKTTSKYYNEADLQILGGIRMIILFFILLSNNTYAITNLPHREFGGANFFSTSWFFFQKIGTYSFECYKALDGFYFGFKLLGFIKERGEDDFSFKKMLIFYFKFLPQFMVLIISLFCFHLFIMECGLFFGSRIIFEYFIEKNVNYKHCVTKPLYLFIPLYYQYFQPSNDHSYPYCFGNFHFMLGEFYCYTFVLFLTYLLLLFKCKWLDLAMYILNILLLCLAHFSYHDKIIGEPYTLEKVYDSTKSYLYPHLFLNLYFIGFNAGVMWFYYKDLTTSRPMNSPNYIPFSFNYKIMKFLDMKSPIVKYCIGIFSAICLIVIAFNFNILLKMNQTSDDNLLINGDWFAEFIFQYAGQLFGIFFIVCIISLLFIQSGPLHTFFSNKLFIPVNRISFAYFCIQDVIVFLFYALYNIEIYMNFQNTFFMTLALHMFILLFSVIVVILCELPVRVVYKKVTSNEKNFNETHLNSSTFD